MSAKHKTQNETEYAVVLFCVISETNEHRDKWRTENHRNESKPTKAQRVTWYSYVPLGACNE